MNLEPGPARNLTRYRSAGTSSRSASNSASSAIEQCGRPRSRARRKGAPPRAQTRRRSGRSCPRSAGRRRRSTSLPPIARSALLREGACAARCSRQLRSSPALYATTIRALRQASAIARRAAAEDQRRSRPETRNAEPHRQLRRDGSSSVRAPAGMGPSRSTDHAAVVAQRDGRARVEHLHHGPADVVRRVRRPELSEAGRDHGCEVVGAGRPPSRARSRGQGRGASPACS